MVAFDAAVRELLDMPAYARLAQVLPSGRPHNTILWYRRVDDHIRIISPASSVRVRALRSRPDVAVLIEHPQNAHDYVDLRGPATIIDDDAAARIELVSIAQRYIGAAAEAYAAGLSDAPRVIIALHPDRVRRHAGSAPSNLTIPKR